MCSFLFKSSISYTIRSAFSTTFKWLMARMDWKKLLCILSIKFIRIYEAHCFLVARNLFTTPLVRPQEIQMDKEL